MGEALKCNENRKDQEDGKDKNIKMEHACQEQTGFEKYLIFLNN